MDPAASRSNIDRASDATGRAPDRRAASEHNGAHGSRRHWQGNSGNSAPVVAPRSARYIWPWPSKAIEAISTPSCQRRHFDLDARPGRDRAAGADPDRPDLRTLGNGVVDSGCCQRRARRRAAPAARSPQLADSPYEIAGLPVLTGTIPGDGIGGRPAGPRPSVPWSYVPRWTPSRLKRWIRPARPVDGEKLLGHRIEGKPAEGGGAVGRIVDIGEERPPRR